MAKDYQIGLLLDFYGSLLLDRQKDIISLYYEEELSLADEEGITRQGGPFDEKNCEYNRNYSNFNVAIGYSICRRCAGSAKL